MCHECKGRKLCAECDERSHRLLKKTDHVRFQLDKGSNEIREPTSASNDIVTEETQTPTISEMMPPPSATSSRRSGLIRSSGTSNLQTSQSNRPTTSNIAPRSSIANVDQIPPESENISSGTLSEALTETLN